MKKKTNAQKLIELDISGVRAVFYEGGRWESESGPLRMQLARITRDSWGGPSIPDPMQHLVDVIKEKTGAQVIYLAPRPMTPDNLIH